MIVLLMWVGVDVNSHLYTTSWPIDHLVLLLVHMSTYNCRGITIKYVVIELNCFRKMEDMPEYEGANHWGEGSKMMEMAIITQTGKVCKCMRLFTFTL